MIKSKLLLVLLFVFNCSFGQVNDSLFSRLQAISNGGIDFYNVDGIEISSQKLCTAFTPKSISKSFKQFKIKKSELIQGDSLLGYENYSVFKSIEEPKGIQNNMSNYFVKAAETSTIGFSFSSINKRDQDFERQFIKLVLSNQIPKTVFNELQIDSIDFAGRKIPLGSSCQWMGVNNVQCRYYGQMNWSVHKDFEDAQKTVNYQFESLKSRKSGVVVMDTIVNVIFEGTDVTARKIVYDFTGATSLVVGMTGGKTLTIYYVAAPVREHFVSCVMSFWNNDQINPSGLSPLLEEVMRLR